MGYRVNCLVNAVFVAVPQPLFDLDLECVKDWRVVHRDDCQRVSVML